MCAKCSHQFGHFAVLSAYPEKLLVNFNTHYMRKVVTLARSTIYIHTHIYNDLSKIFFQRSFKAELIFKILIKFLVSYFN